MLIVYRGFGLKITQSTVINLNIISLESMNRFFLTIVTPIANYYFYQNIP